MGNADDESNENDKDNESFVGHKCPVCTNEVIHKEGQKPFSEETFYEYIEAVLAGYIQGCKQDDALMSPMDFAMNLIYLLGKQAGFREGNEEAAEVIMHGIATGDIQVQFSPVEVPTQDMPMDPANLQGFVPDPNV